MKSRESMSWGMARLPVTPTAQCSTADIKSEEAYFLYSKNQEDLLQWSSLAQANLISLHLSTILVLRLFPSDFPPGSYSLNYLSSFSNLFIIIQWLSLNVFQPLLMSHELIRKIKIPLEKKYKGKHVDIFLTQLLPTIGSNTEHFLKEVYIPYLLEP